MKDEYTKERQEIRREWVRDGDSLRLYLSDTIYPALSREEQRELIAKAQQGDEAARDKVILHNMGLVRKRARFFAERYGVEMVDIMQCGAMGLMIAIQKFDLTRDVQFSTYAWDWIRQQIVYSIMWCHDPIRRPARTHAHISLVKRVVEKLRKEMGREPTETEIAFKAKLPKASVRSALRSATMKVMPFSDFIAEDEEGEDAVLDRSFPSTTFLSPEEGIEAQEELEKLVLEVRSMLDFLRNTRQSPQHAVEVFCLRYGIGDSFEKRTLQEVGTRFGVSRERIRQIEAKAWQILERVKKEKQDSFGEKLNQIISLTELLGVNLKDIDFGVHDARFKPRLKISFRKSFHQQPASFSTE